VFQVLESSVTQTELTCLGVSGSIAFAKKLDDYELYFCDSFITCNTLVDDYTPVVVDSEVQTIESGNTLQDNCVQTDITLCDKISCTQIFHAEFPYQQHEQEHQSSVSMVSVQTVITGI
jgi:hypothetical protein